MTTPFPGDRFVRTITAANAVREALARTDPAPGSPGAEAIEMYDMALEGACCCAVAVRDALAGTIPVVPVLRFGPSSASAVAVDTFDSALSRLRDSRCDETKPTHAVSEDLAQQILTETAVPPPNPVLTAILNLAKHDPDRTIHRRVNGRGITAREMVEMFSANDPEVTNFVDSLNGAALRLVCLETQRKIETGHSPHPPADSTGDLPRVSADQAESVLSDAPESR